MTTTQPEIGRCQHCQQIRPIWRYNRTHDNGDPIWATPCPPHWGTPGAWLCARDWSAADTARVNGRSFHVEHDLEVWPWEAAKPRFFTPDGELLSRADADLKVCEAILAATEQPAGGA